MLVAQLSTSSRTFILVRRVSLGVVVEQLLQVRDGALIAGKVVEFAVEKRLAKVADVVDQKFFGAVDVLGKLPDHVNIHHVFEADAAHRPGSSLSQVDFLGETPGCLFLPCG